MKIQNSKLNSKLIILSNITSKLGNVVFDYTNQMLITMIAPTSPKFMDFYQFSENIVSILFNLFAGAIIDKNSRKRLLLITDILSGCTCIVGIFFLKSPYVYISLIITNILLSILSSFNSPAYNAIVKESISSSYIERHLSNFNIFKECSSIISPTLGILIWQTFGLTTAYIFNALSFFISALFTLKIGVKKHNPLKLVRNKNIFMDIKEGMIYIYKQKMVFNLLIFSCFINFFLSGYNILLPYLNNIFQENYSNTYGIILILHSIGSISFSYLNTRFSTSLSLDRKLNFSTMMLGLCMIFVPILHYTINNFNLTLLPFLGIGGFISIFNIQFFTTIQKKVDTDFIGRVYSVIFTVSILFMPIGSIVFGFIFNNIDIEILLFIGIFVILTSLGYHVLNLKNKLP